MTISHQIEGYNYLPIALTKFSDYLMVLLVDQVVVIRLGKEFLRISISIMTIMPVEKIKIYYTYEVSTCSHRSVMLVLVSDSLIRSPNSDNVASRKIRN